MEKFAKLFSKESKIIEIAGNNICKTITELQHHNVQKAASDLIYSQQHQGYPTTTRDILGPETTLSNTYYIKY